MPPIRERRPLARFLFAAALAVALVFMATPGVEAAHPNLRIAFVGVGDGFDGNEAGDDLPLDIPGATFFRITAGAFNGLSPAVLRLNYDVLVFTKGTVSTLNADWTKRLVPYMALGGGVIWDGDPNNAGDLAPGVTASPFLPIITGSIVSALFR